MSKKVVLITGASSGIGRAVAVELAQDYVVYATAPNTDVMLDLSELGIHVMELDVTNDEQMEHVVSEVIRRSHKIDILFNNAGTSVFGAVETIPLEEARKQIEINLFGMANLSQKVIPYMREQGHGLIVNTSSGVAKLYIPMSGWYTASKCAINGLSDTMRFELKDFGIKVVVVEPGPILTNIAQIQMDTLVEHTQSSPYQKIGEKSVKFTHDMYYKHAVTTPEGAAIKIKKIMQKKNPKAYYQINKSIWWASLCRTLIGHKNYDKILKKLIS